MFNLFKRTPEPAQEVEEPGPQLDPRGLVRTDIRYIRERILRGQPAGWRKGMTLEEVAYVQGMHDMVHLIETKVIGRKTDA